MSKKCCEIEMFEGEVVQASSGNSCNTAQSLPVSQAPVKARSSADDETAEAREGSKQTRVPSRLYQLIGEVLSYTARVDLGLTSQSDESEGSDIQQGEVRS